MESVQKDHDKVWATARNSKTRDQAEDIIKALQAARDAIAEDPSTANVTLVKLQNPVKASFESMLKGLKDVHTGHTRYQRALDKVFKDKPVPSNEIDALSKHSTLINRAVYLHMLREGLFDVASQFHEEAWDKLRSEQDMTTRAGGDVDVNMNHPLGLDQAFSENMQEQFTKMYHILSELKEHHNLQPAIDWARENSGPLEARGSNLEFELCRLKYTLLFLGKTPMEALIYAQSEYQHFRGRYMTEISQLLAAQAFATNLDESPYATRFNNAASWDEVATSFTREFCSLLELSADSPLYVAATAGAIALPTLLKLQAIQKSKHTEWTSQEELPAETPLPPGYQFHSIFVCPVSKEQTTDNNPPMMLPCGHVIAQETMQKLAKGAKFKCPYCPIESHPRDTRRVFL